jgi:hypothetical protein
MQSGGATNGADSQSPRIADSSTANQGAPGSIARGSFSTEGSFDRSTRMLLAAAEIEEKEQEGDGRATEGDRFHSRRNSSRRALLQTRSANSRKWAMTRRKFALQARELKKKLSTGRISSRKPLSPRLRRTSGERPGATRKTKHRLNRPRPRSLRTPLRLWFRALAVRPLPGFRMLYMNSWTKTTDR